MLKKNKLRIVLVPTVSFPISKAAVYIPLGLLAIKSYINEEAEVIIADITVLIKEGIVKADDNFYFSVREYLSGFEADLYAFSTKSGSLIQTITMAENLKAVMPNTLIALGGAQATACAEEILERCAVDFVIRGEGEIPFSLLVQALKTDNSILDIPSLTFKNKRNPDAPRITNLDELPMPDYGEYRKYYSEYLSDKPKYDIQSYVPIDSGRGCPASCKFCYSPFMWRRQCRLKSAERLFDEVKYLYNEFGINSVFFTEDNFTLFKNRVQTFCALLIESKLPISWNCYSRIDTLDKETVHIMKEAGCRQIYYGVESGSQKILDLLGKHYTAAEAQELISYTVNCGIEVTASYIVGFTEETDEDMALTLNAYADSLIAGAVSKLHLLGIEYGTQYYEDIKSEMVFCPSLSKDVLATEYLINDEMYVRISVDNQLYSYFYVRKSGFFSENWVKKFRIEYNFCVFSRTLERIRTELSEDFLFSLLKEMVKCHEKMSAGKSLEDKVIFFKNSLLHILEIKEMKELAELVRAEYNDWKIGKKSIKMISKTL